MYEYLMYENSSWNFLIIAENTPHFSWFSLDNFARFSSTEPQDKRTDDVGIVPKNPERQGHCQLVKTPAEKLAEESAIKQEEDSQTSLSSKSQKSQMSEYSQVILIFMYSQTLMVQSTGILQSFQVAIYEISEEIYLCLVTSGSCLTLTYKLWIEK